MRAPFLPGLLAALLLCGGRAQVADAAAPFAFGLVADVQYADKDAPARRQYRASLGKLREAVGAFNARPLAFVVELGDLTDGQPSHERGVRDLEAVMAVLRQLRAPLHHAFGSHGYRDTVPFLGVATRGEFADPAAPGWRFVILDGNDDGYAKMSEAQVKWFGEALDRASAAREKVVVFCHYPLLQAMTDHRLANPEGVLREMDRAGCVAAWFDGHEHRGSYAFRNGVHHVNVAGMVDTPDTAAWAVVEVRADGFHETGFGREPSRVMPFGAPMASPSKPAAGGAR
jgi:hypothetical protein